MHDPRLETAFELLAEVADEMHSAGRRAYAAAVKPRLIAKTNGGFDEHTLGTGFASFREFIEAAAEAGVVTVRPAPVGPDVEVLPLGAQSLGPRQRPSHGVRIRRDLWRAFLDWKPDQLRAYDRVRDHALLVPASAAPLEPASHSNIRAALADSERYVPIEPITLDQQLEWMRRFVERATGTPIRGTLELALNADHPFRAFSHALSIDPAAREGYNDFRLDEVITRLKKWMSDYGLDLDIYETADRGEPPVAEESTASDETVRLRGLIHAAIDRMPRDALNRIHIPAEFFLD